MTLSRIAYTRVMFKGEMFYVVGESQALIPPEKTPGEYLLVPTFLLIKIESSTPINEPIMVLQAFPFECVPMTSEIQKWLYKDLPPTT